MTLQAAALARVLTGAGISGALPAGLPMGNALRDDVLRLLFDGARSFAADAAVVDDLGRLLASGRKLEVVLGRLWGIVGPDALGCLLALRVAVPNEAHLLSALHLSRGGTHATLNFDVGIELAHDLITGRAQLPAEATDRMRHQLPSWRALAGSGAPLQTVATRADFDDWDAQGRPPALLKLHGSLSRDQTGVVDPVVVDVEEVAQLSAGRQSAVAALAQGASLLVTGYAGADPDVYAPVLDAASRVPSQWLCYSLTPGSPVPEDARARGIELIVGPPGGLAVTGLRALLGLPDEPSWPADPVAGPLYTELFAEWAARLRAQHGDRVLAHAWAWLAADLGDHNGAIQLMRRVVQGSATPPENVRLAEMLYTRAGPGDRDEAAGLYRRVAASRGVPRELRVACLIRSGDLARGRAVQDDRSRIGRALSAARALAAPAVAIPASLRAGRRTEQTADALRAVQQTWLRLLEQAAVVAPAPLWPALARAAVLALPAGRSAAAWTGNGNRAALSRQHGLSLQVLSAFLSGRAATAANERELRDLRAVYLAADDLPGAGNCTAALSLAAAARDAWPEASQELGRARTEFRYGEADLARPMIAAGAALVSRLQLLQDRRADERRRP